MSSIVVLDDDIHRLQSFAAWFRGNITTCRDVPGCIALCDVARLMYRAVRRGRIETLYLDHGVEVIQWLVANRDDCIPAIREIVVHSHNHPAATEMVAKLRDAGFNCHAVPFRELVERHNG